MMAKRLTLPCTLPAPRQNVPKLARGFSYREASTRPLPSTQKKIQNQPWHSQNVLSSNHRSVAHISSDHPGQPLLDNPMPAFFSSSDWHAGNGVSGGNGDHKPPDERIVRLGKTLRILSDRLPTLLVNPLPQDILSPNITLHLFPSTHPHLPTVRGKVPYRAALWTAPVAWGSVPILGNVKLQIMSERMVPAGTMTEVDRDDKYRDEKLVVRWVTEGGRSGVSSSSASKVGRGSKTEDCATPNQAGTDRSGNNKVETPTSSSSNGINRGLSTLLGGDSPIFKLGKEEQFTGLFIFSFDNEGRIATHTIEHSDESRGCDRTAKVVTLTDWLIGKAKGGNGPRGIDPEPALTSANMQASN